MKAKYIYTIMMAMALTSGMASCDDDDNNGNTEQQKPATKTELKCDMDTVKVGIGETASFNILSYSRRNTCNPQLSEDGSYRCHNL